MGRGKRTEVPRFLVKQFDAVPPNSGCRDLRHSRSRPNAHRVRWTWGRAWSAAHGHRI